MVTRHNAGKYLRISDDRQGLGLGVERQSEDCDRLAEQLGWTISETYTDNDISAYSGKRRPAYERMLNDLDAGRIDAVLAWHPDRLHRAPRELEDFITLLERTKATVATVTAGHFDLATPTGRMVARIVGATARQESEHKAERIKRKHQQLAEAGAWTGSRRQYGYSPDHQRIDPDEAANLREAATRILAGDALTAICRDWNARPVPTVSGADWSQTVLRRSLTSPSIAAFRERNGVLYPGTWPAILDPDTWRQLRAVLLDPARRRGGGARSYLLTGFLRCSKCGANLAARPTERKVRGYVCAKGSGRDGCGGLRIMADPLEALVTAKLFERVDRPEVADTLNARSHRTPEDEALDGEIAADLAALDELVHDRYVARIMAPGDYVAQVQTLEARIAANRRRLSRVQVENAGAQWAGRGGALQAAWPNMSLDAKRAVLAAYLERVVVGPALRGLNVFDERRILPERGGRVVWREF